jgi:hypothetical protein
MGGLTMAGCQTRLNTGESVVIDGGTDSDAGPGGGAAPEAGPDGCPDGTVWVHADWDFGHFTPFCGRLCTTTLDCPQGMACVKDEYAWSYPGPVCVSDQVPPPRATPLPIIWDAIDSYCQDASTLWKRYMNSTTGFAGWEILPCPGGCRSIADAGWGQQGGVCSSTVGDAGGDAAVVGSGDGSDGRSQDGGSSDVVSSGGAGGGGGVGGGAGGAGGSGGVGGGAAGAGDSGSVGGGSGGADGSASAGDVGGGATLDGGPDSCPDGTVWVRADWDFGHFAPFCGQLCTITPDCPKGMACVKDEYTGSYPSPVCVSDQVPPPRATPLPIIWDTVDSYCQDASTLRKRYMSSTTGFAGWEILPCPGGCRSIVDAGWGQQGGVCSSTVGDASAGADVAGRTSSPDSGR